MATGGRMPGRPHGARRRVALLAGLQHLAARRSSGNHRQEPAACGNGCEAPQRASRSTLPGNMNGDCQPFCHPLKLRETHHVVDAKYVS